MGLIVKPSIKKAFFINILKIGIVSLILIVIVVMFHLTINLSLWSIIIILLAAFFLMVFVDSSIAQTKIELKTDVLTWQKGFLFFKTKRTLKYLNIASVDYQDRGYFNELFGVGSIIFDLTRLGEGIKKLNYIENVSEVTKKIHSVLLSDNVKAHTELASKYELKHLIDE